MTMSACVRSSLGWGVVKSLGGIACGPVVLIHTQKFQLQKKEKAHLCELRHFDLSSISILALT